MNKTFENIRTNAESLRTVSFTTPTGTIGQTIHRGVQMLPYRDRGRYMYAAAILGLLGVVALPSGVMMHSALLTAGGWAAIIAGIVMALRLDPSQLEAQVVQTERDMEKIKLEHGRQCQGMAKEHVDELGRSLSTEARLAVKNGATLHNVSEHLQRLEKEWRGTEGSLVNELAEKRKAVQQRREEFQKARAALNNASKDWKAQFIPSRARRPAQGALTALNRLTEAECEEIQTSTCLKACRGLAEVASAMGHNHGTVTAFTAGEDPRMTSRNDVPWWMGTPLPPVEMLESAAVEQVRAQMPRIRESVIAASQGGENAEVAVTEAVTLALNGGTPWPSTIRDYLATLNGDTDSFIDRLFKEAGELCPSRPIPGRNRHRKLFAFTGGSGASLAVKAIKDRAPDSVGIYGNEYLPSELLVIAEERNVVLSELPEAMSCIEAFRALPREKQELMVTAVEYDEDVINYHPEKPHDDGHPARLLGCALTLGTVTRSGCQEYMFAGRAFAKGYRAAEDALRIEQRLAAQVEAKVEEVVTQDGFGIVITKLENARQNPGTVVPKEFVTDFVAAVVEAIAELNHRAEISAVVK